MPGNFRAHYLERVGGLRSSADTVKLLEEQILCDPIRIDTEQLTQFVYRYEVPSAHRVFVWKILLAIAPCYTSAGELVEQYRVEQAQLLFRSLRVMRKCSNSSDDDNAQPNALVLVRMLQLETGKLPVGEDDPWTPADLARQVMAEKLLALSAVHSTTTSDNSSTSWSNAYWLLKQLDRLVSKELSKTSLAGLMSDLKQQIALADQPLWCHLGNNSLFERLDIEHWFRSAAAAILDLPPLMRLWDKLIASESPSSLLVSVLVEFMVACGSEESKRRQLFDDISDSGVSTGNFKTELADDIWTLSVDSQEKVVNRVIESCAKNIKSGCRKRPHQLL